MKKWIIYHPGGAEYSFGNTFQEALASWQKKNKKVKKKVLIEGTIKA